MPDEVWERWAATIGWWVSYPGVQAWWRAKPTPFSESFSAFVETCIRDNRFDPATAERWRNFVQHGSAAAGDHAVP